MLRYIRFDALCNWLKNLAIIGLLFVVCASCENNTSRQAAVPAGESLIPIIKNKAHLTKIVEASTERLLMIDFYADWCPPCKELDPILEEIAKENRTKVDIYKVNVDQNNDLMNAFHVTGIPHVAFIRDKEQLFSLRGLYPKTMYLKMIDRYSPAVAAK
ncbi:MAG: thioredoxin family protein [Proteobacteria bacterium]|nr:thioredoxin family protein [Pseudomonadota bacterium]